MSKSFNQFDVVSLLRNIDYLVGYKGDDGEEIRISGATLAGLFAGTEGKSVQIQFSKNAEAWHYPAEETDEYVRFKAGSDLWSAAFKIVGGKGDAGKGLCIIGRYDTLEALQADVANPQQGDMYNVGTVAPYLIYMYDNGVWESQGKLQGKSAYEVWLDNGNEGAVDDFLNSLKGATGASAYTVWLDNGNEGTVDDFLNSFKGANGTSSYVHIRWGISIPPPQLLTTPADFMGVYSGTSVSAPTDYTAYTWYKVKGESGETAASGNGLPEGGEWGDLLRIDSGGNPYWLKGTNVYVDRYDEVVGLASPAKRTIIAHNGNSNLIIDIHSAMYDIKEDFEVIVFNNGTNKIVTVNTDVNAFFKDDLNAAQLRSNNFLEILFRPIEDGIDGFTVFITMGFKGLDW
ncbi:MAG: hypothetical protein LBL58_19170 [Tannerellaceae bacterium]|jgi:hypothetical protein|nr:hypothetical protein [Tannerellaceae bacterium]